HCPLCRLLLELIPKDIKVEIELRYRARYLEVYEGQNYLGRMSMTPMQDRNQTSTKTAGDSLGRAPKLNMAFIREWLHICETTHDHPAPSAMARYQKPIDVILVDTHENQLIKSSTNNRFLALSYVWGPVPIFQTTASNRSALEKPGGLLLHKAQLPQIIKDAIELVVALQERFLWVDCLCIEQDNAAQKHSQIAQMDIIFSQALVTLIALSANDANPCLPGVRPNTMLPLSGSEHLPAGWMLDILPPDPVTPIFSRTWTFQERMLSKRCLFFTYHYYSYHCSSMYILEHGFSSRIAMPRGMSSDHNSLPPKVAGRLPRNNESHGEILTWPSAFSEYAVLVRLYTGRKLTYSSDRLNAFSGILSLFQYRLGGEMISGLPERVLDLALLWIHEYGAPQLRNREFPSWSWAGWSGRSTYSVG
ncbi:HET-domain-containing protein, partial [Glonium stellatum]